MRRLLLCVLFINSIVASGQICVATNNIGCAGNSSGNITGIRIADKDDQKVLAEFKNLSCSFGSGSPAQNVLLNSGASFDLFSGEYLAIWLSGNGNGTVNTQAGVWLDKNFNDSFEADECILLTSSTGSGFGPGGMETWVNLPCFSNYGKTKMRIRGVANSETLTKNDGCGSLNISGTIYDLEVNLKKAPDPIAGFTLKDFYYTKGPILFAPDSIKSYINYSWIFSDAQSPTSNSSNPTTRWQMPGTYGMFLIAKTCEGADTQAKPITIIAPNHVPNVDFYTDREKVEVFYEFQAFSLSDSGAYAWEWELTTPSNDVYTSSSQNPYFGVDESGKHTLCMRASNDVGPSLWYCRTITGVPPLGHYMGPNHLSDADEGKLYDHGGPDLNYNNNRKVSVDYFQLNTDGSIVDITIERLHLAVTGDKLKIYAGVGDAGNALHPSGGFTKNNIPGLPKKMRVYSGSVYFTFESDSSGTDSGFVISWKTYGLTSVSGNIYIDKDNNCEYDPKSEPGLNHTKILVNSNTITTHSRAGNYFFKSDSTDKIIKPQLPDGWKFQCPISGIDTWTQFRPEGPINFAVVRDTSKNLLNVGLEIATPDGFSVRRGAENSISLNTFNLGNMFVDTLICLIKSDRKTDGLMVKNMNYTSTDTTLQFLITKFDLFDFRRHYISMKLKTTDSGFISLTASVYPKGANRDIDSSDNTYESKLRIVFAFDPNDKQVSPLKEFTERQPTLQYLVRFQNTGTAPADEVVVRDTLSEYLDLNSLELIDASHSCVMEKNGNAIAFRFSEINLQDSFHNEPMSHGYVTYSVKPIVGILPYQKIKNSASIYFDFEKPVLTNTTENYWKIKPALVLKGKTKDTIDICATYFDPGATATDFIDGNLTAGIMVTGKVTNGVKGSYVLIYSVTTSYGQTANVARVVEVMDLSKPHILLDGKNIVNNMRVPVQVSSTFIDKVVAKDTCNTVPKLSIVPGFNGPVNSNIRAIYPIVYYASDSAGNTAWENGYTVEYEVEDKIPPVIQLNTADTICHQINTAYSSVAVSVSDNFSPVNKISVTKSGTVNANAKGLYVEMFIAIDESGNSDTIYRYVMVDDCLMGQGNIPANDIKVWPNPSTGIIHLQLPPEFNRSNVDVFSSDGRFIHRFDIESAALQATIDITRFSSGIYLILVNTDKGAFEKIIVLSKN